MFQSLLLHRLVLIIHFLLLWVFAYCLYSCTIPWWWSQKPNMSVNNLWWNTFYWCVFVALFRGTKSCKHLVFYVCRMIFLCMTFKLYHKALALHIFTHTTLSHTV